MIYKIHRYNYSNDIFITGQYSGINCLGYAKSSNGLNDYDYIITQGGVDYHFIGAHYFFNNNWDVIAGSGVTIVGNLTSGILDKNGVFGRLMHENGHYFFNGHGNIGVMGDVVGDLSYSPWEKIALGYVTPTVSNYSNNGYEEILLDDISARISNGKYILSVKTPDDYEFLLASRYKVSNWDRPMLGDVAHYNLNAPGGEGVYLYHNASYSYSIANKSIDIECADGLWKWEQNGYDAPDWDVYNSFLPVLNKTDVVRDLNDDGLGVNINQNPDAAKDGLTVFGQRVVGNNTYVYPKYFSKGKKGSYSVNGVCGTDRVETNIEDENWTSREFQVDRWDAWKPGYNEIFSPYSSPSTISWYNQPTGLFIWIKDYDESTKKTTVRIYRDAAYNTGGMLESDILNATPPSRPMGIKLHLDCVDTYIHPRITWKHNQEPDMIRAGNVQRYIIQKAISEPNHVPVDYINLPPVDIPITSDPEYIDDELWYNCGDGNPWISGYVRYRVVAVDKTDMPSVPSDFVATPFWLLNGDDHVGINTNEKPKTYSLQQNYPNPFNPITNIRYSVKDQKFVTLKIYDILGREVKTLVNEVKTPGEYLVQFDGSELASGIYFYRIVAGNYIAVKRMVLIK